MSKVSFPDDFHCFDKFGDIPDDITEEIVNELIDVMKNNEHRSVAIKSLGDTEVIIFKQFRNSINKMAYRIIVFKNYYEKIIELDEINENEHVFTNQEEAEKSDCLDCRF